MTRPDVVIVGAGLAGLACGKRLAECGRRFQIVEAADAVGGRCRTDVVDGFRLDRGFPCYLTASPEGRRVLDYDALDLRPLARHLLVRFGGRFHRVADPRSGPLSAIRFLAGPVGTIRDNIRAVRFLAAVARDSFDRIETRDDRPAIDLLRHAGLGPKIIDRYFRPLLASFFLERELATSSRYLRFVLKLLVDGTSAVPAVGMQAIPDQLAAKLPAGSIRLLSRVERLEPGTAVLSADERIEARCIVVATAGLSAAKLLDGAIDVSQGRIRTAVHFVADRPPAEEAVLVLNAEGKGIVNDLIVGDQPTPAGSLVSATVVDIPSVDDETIELLTRDQLRDWFGTTVDAWRMLCVRRNFEALPDMSVGKLDPWRRPVRLRPGLYVCGDHRNQGGINGALESGFRAAQAAMEDLAAKRA